MATVNRMVLCDHEGPVMYCLYCQYDLRGQVEPRCPECGRRYDPSNRATFRADLRWHAPAWMSDLAGVVTRGGAMALLCVPAAVLFVIAAHCADQPARGKPDYPVPYMMHNVRAIAPLYVHHQRTSISPESFTPGALLPRAPRGIARWQEDLIAAHLLTIREVRMRRLLYIAPCYILYASILALLLGRAGSRRREPALATAALLSLCMCCLLMAPAAVADLFLKHQGYGYLYDFVYLPLPPDGTANADGERAIALYSRRPNRYGFYAVGFADGRWGVTRKEGLQRRLTQLETLRSTPSTSRPKQ